MHRFWFILVSLVLLLTIMPLAACDDDDEESGETMALITSSQSASSEPENTSREIAPETSNDEPAKTQMRIISLAPSNTEILFALGLEDQVVGVTEYCDYPEAATEKLNVGGFSTVDMEKVIELDPDLILAADIHKETIAPELERRGYYVQLLNPKTLQEVLDSIKTVGDLTGKSQEASGLVDEMNQRIDAIVTQVATLSDEEKPGVFYVTYTDPLYTLGADTLTNDLIRLAGGINIFADGEGNFETDLETVLWRNPTVILASTGHGDAANSPVIWIQTDKRLGETDARVNGRIYEINADIVTRPGPRAIDGLEAIARFLHPDLFATTE